MVGGWDVYPLMGRVSKTYPIFCLSELITIPFVSHSGNNWQMKLKLISAGIIAVLLLAIFGWRASRTEPVPELVTAPVVVGDIEDTVVATGKLEAAQLVSVGAQVSGQIKVMRVALGDEVRAGDLIAEIDSITQENELRNARAALAQSQAQRAVELAALNQAGAAFERQRMMLAEDATSHADYESAEALLNSKKAQVQALDAQITQRQIDLDTARANLEYTKIRAPMSGTVVALVVKEGQTVNANQTAPTIVKLAKLDSMTVNADISEADVIKVERGQTVYFTVLGNPSKRYYGKLRMIEPAPDSMESESKGVGAANSSSSSSSHAIYYTALFDVPNANGELRLSMTTQVYIVLAEAKHALTIPSVALGEKAGDGRYPVTVIDRDGNPVARQIVVGLNNNITAQVLEGLELGERVTVRQ